MNARTISTINALETMRIPELQARYLEVLGEATRCPNRIFLVRKISAALAANDGNEGTDVTLTETTTEAESLADSASGDLTEVAQTDESDTLSDPPDEGLTPPGLPIVLEPTPTVPNTEPLPPASEKHVRGRFSGMTVEELQQRYVETVGRPSGSANRRYLEWKIREAEKGHVPVGPRNAHRLATAPVDVKVLPLRIDAQLLQQVDAAWRTRGIKSRMEFLRLAVGHYLEHLDA